MTLLFSVCGRGSLKLKNLSCRICEVSRTGLTRSCHHISEKDNRFISHLFCALSTLVWADSSWRCFLLFFRDIVCSHFQLLFGIGSFIPFCLLNCFSKNFFSNYLRWLLWNGQILVRSQPGSHFLLILVHCPWQRVSFSLLLTLSRDHLSSFSSFIFPYSFLLRYFLANKI